MHLGNIYAALMSWLSARRQGGRWILRIEDLDPQRSKPEFSRLIEDDLRWLGLEWDEGGIADGYCQSLRGHFYADALRKLEDLGLVYACRCTRAGLRASSAPHASDGRAVYAGTCRPAQHPPFTAGDEKRNQLVRVYGITFPKKAMLDEYLVLLEEAKKRDHRKLGKEMELFAFSPKVGAGLQIGRASCRERVLQVV